MKFLKDIIVSLMFITRMPLGFLRVKLEDTQRAVIHFPLAGYFAFVFWYVAFMTASLVFTRNFVPICLSFAVLYFFFNLFHFDGFLDSIDGLLSQKPREEALRIMKLGNIGPMAFFFGFIYMYMKIYLAATTDIFAFLMIFVLARWGMSFTAMISKSASDSGLASLVAFRKPLYFLLSSVYIVPLFFLFKPEIAAILAGSVIIADLVMAKAIEIRLGGLTGDNFGFISEVNELLMLLILFGMRR
jgi:adenosylcobinamide-GDP ribazoletransferase